MVNTLARTAARARPVTTSAIPLAGELIRPLRAIPATVITDIKMLPNFVHLPEEPGCRVSLISPAYPVSIDRHQTRYHTTNVLPFAGDLQASGGGRQEGHAGISSGLRGTAAIAGPSTNTPHVALWRAKGERLGKCGECAKALSRSESQRHGRRAGRAARAQGSYARKGWLVATRNRWLCVAAPRRWGFRGLRGGEGAIACQRRATGSNSHPVA
jgi:hypothetical protein